VSFERHCRPQQRLLDSPEEVECKRRLRLCLREVHCGRTRASVLRSCLGSLFKGCLHLHMVCWRDSSWGMVWLGGKQPTKVRPIPPHTNSSVKFTAPVQIYLSIPMRSSYFCNLPVKVTLRRWKQGHLFGCLQDGVLWTIRLLWSRIKYQRACRLGHGADVWAGKAVHDDELHWWRWMVVEKLILFQVQIPQTNQSMQHYFSIMIIVMTLVTSSSKYPLLVRSDRSPQ